MISNASRRGDGGDPVASGAVIASASRGRLSNRPFSFHVNRCALMKRPASRNRGAIRRILTRGAEFFYPSFANHDAMRLTFIQIFNLLRALIVSLDIFLARLEAALWAFVRHRAIYRA